MESAIKETNRRRKIQETNNKEHGIVPTTIKKEIRDSVKATEDIKQEKDNTNGGLYTLKEGESIKKAIERLTEEMMSLARKYEFEKAANIRDFIEELKNFN